MTKTRARRMARLYRSHALAGLCLGLAATLSTLQAPAPQIVRLVPAPAPVPMPAPAPAPVRAHVPETSANAWDILESSSYPDGYIAPKRSGRIPKPRASKKEKD